MFPRTEPQRGGGEELALPCLQHLRKPRRGPLPEAKEAELRFTSWVSRMLSLSQIFWFCFSFQCIWFLNFANCQGHNVRHRTSKQTQSLKRKHLEKDPAPLLRGVVSRRSQRLEPGASKAFWAGTSITPLREENRCKWWSRSTRL